jgi:phospholipase C
MVVIVTYDEFGGYWDHVPPPKGDRWGPGSRIPAIVISPFARRHYVDHTPYDTTSILKLIENRFGLKPLGQRDAAANDLTGALQF